MRDFSTFAARERAGWNNRGIVDAYVRLFGPVTDEVARALSDRVAAPGRKILDLCCGQGSLTAILAEAGAEVTGLDISEDMLAIASARAPQATLQCGDAAELPFPDNRFDAVVCNFGMMHLPDQPKALSEIRRVLAPGGRFVMATWDDPQTSPAFGTVLSAIRAHADMSSAPAQPDLFAFADPDTASRMLSDAGLSMKAHEVVTPAWQLAAPAELFEIFMNGTVGIAMLMKGQKQEAIEAIRSQVTATVAEKFQAESGYRVPVPVAIVTAGIA